MGRDVDTEVIAVVMLQTDNTPQKTREPDPTATDGGPAATDSTASSEPTPTPTPKETASARSSSDPVEPSPGDSPKPSDDPSVPAETPAEPPPSASAEPTVTPEIDPTETPGVPATTQATPLATAVETPPPSAVAGLTVLSILENVRSVGAPPAWSRDGSVLAFSAMPANGAHGPDVYVWRPGDAQAHAITSDHGSFFASWSGRRIVVSRIDVISGKSDSVDVRTVVIDPQTLEEREVEGPQMWLPVVDGQRSHAIVWNGKIDRNGALPVLRSGGLYLVDWTELNPYRVTPSDEADEPVDQPEETPASDQASALIPLQAERDPAAKPVVDWQVRWSGDGRVVGIWEADTPNASWGHLELFAFDPVAGLVDTASSLIGRQLAKRGFALGLDRVAWVGASEEAEGELRIRTWGDDGVGGLRIKTVDLREMVPAF